MTSDPGSAKPFGNELSPWDRHLSSPRAAPAQKLRNEKGVNHQLDKCVSGSLICLDDWSERLEMEGLIIPVKPPLN